MSTRLVARNPSRSVYYTESGIMQIKNPDGTIICQHRAPVSAHAMINDNNTLDRLSMKWHSEICFSL